MCCHSHIGDKYVPVSLYISFNCHTQGDDLNATPLPLPEYVPSSGGLTHDLPDGVMVQLRLHLVNERYQVCDLHHAHIHTTPFEYVWECVAGCHFCIVSTEYM